MAGYFGGRKKVGDVPVAGVAQMSQPLSVGATRLSCGAPHQVRRGPVSMWNAPPP